MSFIYTKFKIIKESENPYWLFRNFVNSTRMIEGRIVKLSDGSLGNHQIKHPNYSNWFDIPSNMVEVLQSNTETK